MNAANPIVIQYVGEEGPDCILKGAVVCSNPWNLEVSSVALWRTIIGREVYSRVMADNLKKLIEMSVTTGFCAHICYVDSGARHKEQVSKNTGVKLPRLFETKYLHEFDR